MERASVERQAASAAAATIKAMGGHLNKRGESSGASERRRCYACRAWPDWTTGGTYVYVCVCV